MATTLTTFDAMLYDNYKGPVIDALNNSSVLYQRMKKQTLKWEGRRATLVALVTQGASGTYSAAGIYPVAGEEGYVNLQITAARYLDRRQIDGLLLAQASKGGSHAFVAASRAAAESLKEAAMNAMNQRAYSGGTFVGWLNQLKAEAGAADWEFAGDISKLDAASTGANSCTVNLVRMDTYAAVSTETVDTVSPQDMTIHFTGAADTSVGTLGAGIQTHGIAVQIATSTVAGFVAGLNDEPVGFYGNMSAGTHFGQDRTTATGTAVQLQGNIITAERTGAQGKVDLAVEDLQFCMDTSEENSTLKPDVLICHYSQRQKYAALFQAVMRVNSADKKGGAAAFDAGFSELSYNGTMLVADRHCGRGLILGIHSESWKYCPTVDGDLDYDTSEGQLFHDVPNTDAKELRIKAYYQTCLAKPRACFAMVGLNHV